jgi:hypothetical protein
MDLVDQVDAAVFAGLDCGQVGCNKRIPFGQRSGMERPRCLDHIHDPVAHCVRLLEHANGLGAAAPFDLDQAFALRVYLVHKGQKALRLDQCFGKGVDRRDGFFCLGHCPKHHADCDATFQYIHG